jgi:hypothetical protein
VLTGADHGAVAWTAIFSKGVPYIGGRAMPPRRWEPSSTWLGESAWHDSMRSAIHNIARHGGSLKNAGSCGTSARPGKRNSQISLQVCSKMCCATPNTPDVQMNDVQQMRHEPTMLNVAVPLTPYAHSLSSVRVGKVCTAVSLARMGWLLTPGHGKTITCVCANAHARPVLSTRAPRI